MRMRGRRRADGLLPAVPRPCPRAAPVAPARTKRSSYSPLTGLIEAGKLTPVLDRTYPLAGTAEGLRGVEQGHARGKVVITVA
jgi:NADPH:quinone reductase-like Zn-dependent oxidoreductase